MLSTKKFHFDTGAGVPLLNFTSELFVNECLPLAVSLMLLPMIQLCAIRPRTAALVLLPQVFTGTFMLVFLNSDLGHGSTICALHSASKRSLGLFESGLFFLTFNLCWCFHPTDWRYLFSFSLSRPLFRYSTVYLVLFLLYARFSIPQPILFYSRPFL